MKNIRSILVFSLALSLIAAGCAQQQKALSGIREERSAERYVGADAAAPVEEAQSPSGGSGEEAQKKRKIIVTGNMNLEVKSFDAAARDIEKIAERAGGYVSDSSAQSLEDGSKYGDISIRVPPGGYGSAILKIRALGKVVSEDVSREDVSEEYIDLEARLKNERRVEETYQKLLARAVKISEILSVEEKIGETRGEIEQIEGRLKYLNNQTSLSTLKISIQERSASRISSPSEWNVRDIAKAAAASFMTTSKSLAIAAIWLAVYSPFFIAGVLLIMIVRRIRRRKENN